MPLIVFEGLDGCGKTTQLNFTYDWLVSQGIEVVATRQPGSALDSCQAIAKLLKSPGVSIGDLAETLLFSADRCEHIDKIIVPALKDGKVVLCDRWTYSTIAYQHYGRGIDLGLIENLNNLANGTVKPDLTLYFDVSVETSFKRVGRARDRIESESRDFYFRVLQGYEKIISHHSIDVINGEDYPLEVFWQVKNEIKNLRFVY
jgi:dTMP kinase